MSIETYISVVSHGHAELIKELDVLSLLAKNNTVVIKCNKLKDAKSLKNYCAQNNIYLLDNNYGLGFGANNNFIFDYCKKNLGLESDDIFIVMNPDLKLDATSLQQLCTRISEDSAKLATINLYKDEEKKISDDAIRKFPKMSDFFLSILLKKNNTKYDKSLISKPTKVDWAAGSFLAFKASHYQKLGGFEEKYFMYCEDIDICYRSALMDHKPIYYPNITGVHYAKHANRSLLSKHFYWHIKSAFLFLAMQFKNPIKTK